MQSLQNSGNTHKLLQLDREYDSNKRSYANTKLLLYPP